MSVEPRTIPTGKATYLVDLRKHKVGQERAEDAQRARHKERVLTSPNRIGSVRLDDRKDIGADKSTNLAHGGGVGVVLTTNGSRAGLGCTQTDVVTWTDFTESEEDPVQLDTS